MTANLLDLFAVRRRRSIGSCADVEHVRHASDAPATGRVPVAGAAQPDPALNAIVADAAHRALRAGELLRAGAEDAAMLGQRYADAEALLKRAMP